ncbi:MAG TPA: hypothetical protein VHF26_10765 [Trebonia sp.]|nr:hypothetical protein [Trebonia sp.]
MPKEQWRAPWVLRVKSAAAAAVGVAVAVVFFPVWYAVPVAVVTGAWGLGLAVLGGTVVVDGEAGLLVLRMGLIGRRVRLTEVTAVLVDQAKVSVARTRGGEVSLYAWRKGPLDSLLRVPVVAGDVGHAISRSVALAQAALDEQPAARENRPPAPGRTTPGRTRSRLATALLGCAGVVAIAGALLVRVHWDSPVMTTLGVIIALALGVSGLVYLLVALWILLTGRSPLATFTS